MILTRKSLVQFLFFLYLFLHVLPFIINQKYQLITILNYSIVIFLLIISSFRNTNMSTISIIYMILIGISVFMSILGFSGSISSLIMAASLPHFLFSIINSKEDLLQLLYRPVIIASLLVIIFSFFLYNDIKNLLGDYSNLFYLGKYFVVASINYVPLVFISYGVVAFTVLVTKMDYVAKTRFDSLLLSILILLTTFYSSIFLTRSVFVCSLFLLFAFFKKIRVLFLFLLPIFVFYFYDVILHTFVNFFGGDNIFEILSSDESRADSVNKLIGSSIYHIFYNLDYSAQMSYSTFTNLLFSMFPLTFIFLLSPANAFIKILKKRKINLFLVFLSSFTVIIFQMDFFSIFAFFFFSEYVKRFIDEDYIS